MNCVADQVADLYQLETEGCLHLLDGHQVYVCEQNWKEFTSSSDTIWLFTELGDFVKFLSLEEIGYDRILNLRSKYGFGISIATLYKIEFCRVRSLELISDDRAVIKIAGLEGVEVLMPEDFKERLLDATVKIENYEVVQKKIRR